MPPTIFPELSDLC